MDKGLKSESEGEEQLKKVTKPKKGKGSKAEKPYPTCNTRSSPKPMYEAMMTLSDPQKKCLKDMSFERMIYFPIVELPSALAYHVIDHFHPGRMELRLEKGSLKTTRQKVHDMLRIPMGSRKLEDLEQRPSNNPFIKDIMGTLNNGGKVLTKLLKRITEDVDISDIDWCRPALRSWNTTTMKKRIKIETETRCLGKLEHNGEFDPEEEHDGMNVYKGLDVYIPPINDKEPEKKRSELVRTLRNGVKKFEYDQMMIDFCKQYGELFNDNEFNLYESSKDDDSEEKGSDGKEENMNGDDKEVTVQMDVNNQNEELNKEKDANKTEDNDKMNNNEMKNDSVQMKQDVDKDKNAEKEKVETEKEKQDKAGKVDNCEEMENQAKEEIKKKITTKRKSAKEMTPPSFSLGLSPDTNKVEERAAKRVKNRLDLFGFIFETKEGNATIRDYMQTLTLTLKIESNVIDAYCLVLNHEQGMNSKGKKTKHFFHTGMITKDMFNWKKEDGKKYDEVKQYKAFFDIMKNEFKKDDEVKKIERSRNVFNFLKALNMISDHIENANVIEGIIYKVCDVLKNIFSMHLKEVQHPRAKEMLNKNPTILRPKWGTEENNTDCGVFLMMQMENYNEENARNWNLEFPT
ncbi:hypothetical protein Tco_0451914 [Tanacetum coccineum]